MKISGAAYPEDPVSSVSNWSRLVQYTALPTSQIYELFHCKPIAIGEYSDVKVHLLSAHLCNWSVRVQPVDEDVVALDVSVDDVVGMQPAQRLGDLNGDPNSLL